MELLLWQTRVISGSLNKAISQWNYYYGKTGLQSGSLNKAISQWNYYYGKTGLKVAL